MADPAEPFGLRQLRAALQNGNNIGMGKTIGFHLMEIEAGRAVFGGTPGPHLFNPMRTIHGGFAATLLDSACGCAVHSKLEDGQTFTTLELKIAYHRAMTAETGEVRAEGTLLSFGRRVAFAEAKLTDSSGRLLASATSTLLITS
jgi:uncharacterized protein (TIGR00369 family)